MAVKFKKMLAKVKEEGQDFEWYPTTQEIIDKVNSHLDTIYKDFDDKPVSRPVLDIGAGDGRVLEALTKGGDKFAIEKSIPLIDALPSDIMVVGTDFHETTLIDKEVEVTFCNPPYSEFKLWFQHVLEETQSTHVYLVVPSRWSNDKQLVDLIKERKAEVKVLGTFNFENAERAARAKVDVLYIKMGFSNEYRSEVAVDPFELWFDKFFDFDHVDKIDSWGEEEKTFSEKIDKALTVGKGLIPVLVEMYEAELDHLLATYSQISYLGADILKELGVDKRSIRKSLKVRIEGLKNVYWNKFFEHYTPVTSRLTHSSRNRMFHKLTKHSVVDFTESNCLAVSVWAVKNANQYYDSQLVDLVSSMVDKANIRLYKSNKRLYVDDDWRYGSKPQDLEKFALELRIILTNMGGITSIDSNSWDYVNGLNKRAHKFLEDIITVANNLGFSCYTRPREQEWYSGKKVVFEGPETLMEVKAFKNGNLHIKFNTQFIKSLNIEFGRLKGWLKTKEQVKDELSSFKITDEDIKKFFKSNVQLTAQDVPLLTM